MSNNTSSDDLPENWQEKKEEKSKEAPTCVLNTAPSTLNSTCDSSQSQQPTEADTGDAVFKVPASIERGKKKFNSASGAVSLKPGFSPLDWAKHSAAALATRRLSSEHSRAQSRTIGGRGGSGAASDKLGCSPIPFVPGRKVSIDELRAHSGREVMGAASRVWTCVDGSVYDITEYLPFHPGGQETLMRSAAGRDATKLFYKNHSWVSHSNLLAAFRVGSLDKSQKSQDEELESSFFAKTEP